MRPRGMTRSSQILIKVGDRNITGSTTLPALAGIFCETNKMLTRDVFAVVNRLVIVLNNKHF